MHLFSRSIFRCVSHPSYADSRWFSSRATRPVCRFRRAFYPMRQPCKCSTIVPGLSTSDDAKPLPRSEEHTSELQSLMRISYAVFCLKKKNEHITNRTINKR